MYVVKAGNAFGLAKSESRTGVSGVCLSGDETGQVIRFTTNRRLVRIALGLNICSVWVSVYLSCLGSPAKPYGVRQFSNLQARVMKAYNLPFW